MMTDHPEQHHHIGKSEHMYEDIGTFLRIHQDDPAIKVRYLVYRVLLSLIFKHDEYRILYRI